MIKHIVFISLLSLTTGCSFLGKRFMPHETKVSFQFNKKMIEHSYPASPLACEPECQLSPDPNLFVPSYVVKNIPIECFPKSINQKYFSWGGHCTVRQETLPETINITYAKWVTPDEQEKRGFHGKVVISTDINGTVEEAIRLTEQYALEAQKREWQAIDQEIPPEAWQTIQLDLAEIINKYKGKLPERGEPEDWYSVDRSITITLELLKDGTVKISDSYGWRYPYISHPN